MRLVGYVFPLQYQPEYDGGEQGREGIYLTFHGAEPEGIAECVGQCAYQAAAHNGNQLSSGDVIFVCNYEFTHQVGDAPEKEQYAGTAHQGAHVVHHLGNGCCVRSKLREEVGH